MLNNASRCGTLILNVPSSLVIAVAKVADAKLIPEIPIPVLASLTIPLTKIPFQEKKECLQYC